LIKIYFKIQHQILLIGKVLMSEISRGQDELASRASEEIVQWANDGKIDLSEYLIGIAIESGYSQAMFYDYLDDCQLNDIDPKEFIQDHVGIVCSKERLERILQKKEKIQFSDLLNWLHGLYNQGVGSGLNEYFLIPTSLLGYSDYFIIVQRIGVELEPEYNLVATFASEDAAREYFSNNYDY
jgi:hypothetical protein